MNIVELHNKIKKEDIIEGLRVLGIKPGLHLMVHSSLSSFGYVEGGPSTVISALMEVITPEGTLMMPSFNHGIPFQTGGRGYFHPGETPTKNGIIPDTFWRMPCVLRSLNPTHSFAAWGKNAKRYTEFHHRTLTMGYHSPLGLLYSDGGYCLLMGVDYGTNTFHHFVEVTLEAPCLGLRTEAYPMILTDGRLVEGRTWGWREKGCPITDGNKYHKEIERRGLHRQTVVGKSKLTFFNLKDCYQVVSEALKNGLGSLPSCSQCPIRPQVIPQNVPSDWDKENHCLLPWSPAWLY